MGARDARGYGMRQYEGRVQRAHRVAWQIHNGPIGNGMVVMHSCDNPKCVRLDHLMLGTQSDNVRDCMDKARRSSQKIAGCKRGHAFDAANTRLYDDPRGHVSRNCRACHREYMRAWSKTKKGEMSAT